MMQTATELRGLLKRIDHKGYPAYKDTKGTYQFPVLSVLKPPNPCNPHHKGLSPLPLEALHQ